MQLVSKISNPRDHNPPTSQTDRQTDDMRSQDRALHHRASCGKNEFHGRGSSAQKTETDNLQTQHSEAPF